jgi:hypothetical protein
LRSGINSVLTYVPQKSGAESIFANIAEMNIIQKPQTERNFVLENAFSLTKRRRPDFCNWRTTIHHTYSMGMGE